MNLLFYETTFIVASSGRTFTQEEMQSELIVLYADQNTLNTISVVHTIIAPDYPAYIKQFSSTTVTFNIHQ